MISRVGDRLGGRPSPAGIVGGALSYVGLLYSDTMDVFNSRQVIDTFDLIHD